MAVAWANGRASLDFASVAPRVHPAPHPVPQEVVLDACTGHPTRYGYTRVHWSQLPVEVVGAFGRVWWPWRAP